MMVFDRLFRLEHMILVKHRQVNNHDLTSFKAYNEILGPQWVNMHTCDRVISKFTACISKSAIRTASLSVISIKSAPLCSNDNDLVRDCYARVSFALPLSHELSF